MALEESNPRVSWIDYAKGICLIAVVGLYATIHVQGLAQSEGWVQYWVDFAKPFRMPAFFLISGLFLSRTIDHPWRTYLDRKIVHFIYFFALWTTLYFAVALVAGEFNGGQVLWREYLWWYIEPFHMLWFIAMLPVYFLVARLFRRVPWIIMLPLLALLQIWSPETGLRQLDRFGERYIYFYAGYIFAPLAFQLAAWASARPSRAAGGLLIWSIFNEALVLAGMADKPVFSLTLGLAGAGAVIALASLLSGLRWLDWLRYLGENSIVVFLSFFLFTAASARLLFRFGWIADIGSQTMLVTAISIVGPITLYWTIRQTPLRYMFQRPRWASLERRESSK